MPDAPLVIDPGRLTLADLQRLWREQPPVEMAPSWQEPVQKSADIVADIVKGDMAVYGITTGFGSLAKARIPRDQVTELQRRLVLSHCAGVGAPLPDTVVRTAMVLKVSSLARGFSGVRPLVIEFLLKLIEANASGLGRGVGGSGTARPCRRGNDRDRRDPPQRHG